ncbi:MAG: hypothetical protein M3Q07_15240 [Pseudobdellovibrionaceae bacterium]|nr:hypothetical protein [Pseudobdellovibrionaceae bacterium]
MNSFRSSWKIGLTTSVAAIILGALVREGIISIDDFRAREKIISEPSHSEHVDPGDNSSSASSNEQAGENTPSTANPNMSQLQEIADIGSNKSANENSSARKLDIELSKILAEKGFSAYESETAVRIINDTFAKREGTGDLIVVAVDRASETLSLSTERKKLLRESLFESFAETGGSFTFQSFELCVKRRIKRMNIDDCAAQMAGEFVNDVASKITQDRITPSVQSSLGYLQVDYAKRSVEKCGLDIQQGLQLFYPGLSECPLQ